MKSSLAGAFLLTTLLFPAWTAQATAQQSSEQWLSEASSGVVESFGEDSDLGNCTKESDDYCGPTWKFRADAVFMQRSTPNALVLMQDVLAPASVLNADAFNFDFATGYDVSLERETYFGGLEARFFSIDGWDSATTQVFGPGSVVVINNAMPFGPTGATAVNATYNSELLSAELNLRRQLSKCVSLLGGFRYLELDEHFHADLDVAAIVPSTYDTFTRNRLYGAQLGADATLWCRDQLTIEGLVKAGIFHNSGGQNTVYDTGAVAVVAADTSDRAAFLGELAFTANYCLTDALTLRAGYDLLWLETVALASDQIPATDFGFPGPTGNGISPDGGVFYHGAFVGLEYRH